MIIIEERAHCSSNMWKIAITQQATQGPRLTNTEERQKRRLAWSRARRRHPLLSFGGPGTHHPQGLLGGRREPQNAAVRSSDSDEDFELSSEYSCFLLVGSIFVRLGRASWLKNWDRGRNNVF